MFDFYQVQDVQRETFQQILRARIIAYTHLHRGYDSLQLLRRFRSMGGKGDNRLYGRVLKSLYNGNLGRKDECRLVCKPAELTAWFLREMERDGEFCSFGLTNVLLFLHILLLRHCADCAAVYGAVTALHQSCLLHLHGGLRQPRQPRVCAGV